MVSKYLPRPLLNPKRTTGTFTQWGNAADATRAKGSKSESRASRCSVTYVIFLPKVQDPNTGRHQTNSNGGPLSKQPAWACPRFQRHQRQRQESFTDGTSLRRQDSSMCGAGLDGKLRGNAIKDIPGMRRRGGSVG